MTRQADGWAADITRPIGRAVRDLRLTRGWTGERLIAELADLGVTVSRAALTNLEAGRRENVAVAEVYAYAAALGVPPLRLLVADPGAEVDVLPGVTLDGVRTCYWVTGTYLPGPLALVADGDTEDPVDRFDRESAVFEEFREHDVLARDLAKLGDIGNVDDLAEVYVHRLALLRRHRDKITERGWEPPPIPDALGVDAWLDVATTRPDGAEQ